MLSRWLLPETLLRSSKPLCNYLWTISGGCKSESAQNGCIKNTSMAIASLQAPSPANATAYLSGVVRRDGVTIAISTSGHAPALTALLREALDALLPRDLPAWIERARAQRVVWRRDAVPMDQRKPQLLTALNAIYGPAGEAAASVPWLHAPEDSWL